MRKRVECECGWVCEGTDEEIVRLVSEHCGDAHDGRVPGREQILASARPIDPGAAAGPRSEPTSDEETP